MLALGMRSSSSCRSLRNIYLLFCSYFNAIMIACRCRAITWRKKRNNQTQYCVRSNIFIISLLDFPILFIFFSCLLDTDFTIHIRCRFGIGKVTESHRHRHSVASSSRARVRVSYLSSKTSVRIQMLTKRQWELHNIHDDNKLLSVPKTLIESIAKWARVSSANRCTTSFAICTIHHGLISSLSVSHFSPVFFFLSTNSSFLRMKIKQNVTAAILRLPWHCPMNDVGRHCDYFGEEIPQCFWIAREPMKRQRGSEIDGLIYCSKLCCAFIYASREWVAANAEAMKLNLKFRPSASPSTSNAASVLNDSPEYVNMEWSPLWLVNRIHEHNVNCSSFGKPASYWMVPSFSSAYFSTEHWSLPTCNQVTTTLRLKYNQKTNKKMR